MVLLYHYKQIMDIDEKITITGHINNYIYEQNYGYDKDYDDRDIDI